MTPDPQKCTSLEKVEWYTTQRWMAFSVLFAISHAFLAVDSKLIANFATRTLKNLENGKDNSPKYRDNGFVT
jgi:hypothetical protein